MTQSLHWLTGLLAFSLQSAPATDQPLVGAGNPVMVTIEGLGELEWTVAPEVANDMLPIECGADRPTKVTFATERDQRSFSLKGFETADFTIQLDGMAPASTRIVCGPPALAYRGDYADPAAADPFGDALKGGTFDRHLNEMMAVRYVPGTAVVVTRGSETLLAKGYGVTTPGTTSPVTADHEFRLASSTKVLTSLVMYSLVEDGVIDLDAPVSDYLADTPPSWQGITITHLLNHSSGIAMIVTDPAFEAMSAEQQDALTPADVYRWVKDKPLDFPPGSGSAYRQSGFAILVHIVETKTGKSWQQLLDERLFKPAGMTQTRFAGGFDDGAKDYGLDNGNYVEARNYHYPPALASGGGLVTTASDIAKLFVAVSEGRIVNLDAYKAAMFDLAHIPPQSNYSLGGVIDHYERGASFGHSGGGMADLRYFPDAKIGIAFFGNRAGAGMMGDVTRELSELAMGPAQ